MDTKFLIISTSLRPGSNSDALARAFADGARSTGHEVETISLVGKRIGFCHGCLVCQTQKSCVIQDDANAIVDKMAASDILVFATPIYYNGMSGQMKTLLDRADSLYVRDYRFRSVYLLSTAAEIGDDVDRYAVQSLEGWLALFDRAALAGTIFAGGVNGPNQMEGHPSLARAFRMGASIL